LFTTVVGATSLATVQLNNGAGALTAGQEIAVGSGTSANAILGDVDGDGDLDVVGFANFSNTLTLRLNDGTGKFGGTQQVPLSASATQIALYDLDGDHDLDLLASANFTGKVMVRLNDGTGGFSVGQEVALTSSLTSFTLGDADGDGDLDLLIGNGTVFGKPGRVTVQFNQPAALPLTLTALLPRRNALAVSTTTPIALTFSQALSATTATQTAVKLFGTQAGGLKKSTATVDGSSLSVVPTTAFKPGETVFATLTTGVQGSSGQQLAVGQVYQFTTAVSRSFGYFYAGSDVAAGATPAGVVAAGVVTGDVDGDQDLDLVSATGVQLNNGTGTFSSGASLSIGGTPRAIALGDVDGDGDLDVVVATNTGTGAVQVRLNNGAGTFSGTQQVAVGFDPSGVVLADVDADGDLDLLTANYSSSSASIRLNSGQGSFGAGSEVAVGTQPVSLAVGDVDNDGDLDLLTTSFSGNTVSVRLNNGAGTFSGTREVSVGFNPHSVALGDLDGDGDLDLVTANYYNYDAAPNTSTVSIRINDGFGVFSGTRNVVVRRGAVSVALGDVEGNGSLDILVASENDYDTESGTTSLILNIGNGNSYIRQQEIPVGRGAGSVALGDLDGDGDLDLITGNAGAGTASVRFNQLPSTTGTTVLGTAAGLPTDGLSLYPNPSTGRFTLSCTATKSQTATLVLTDRLGRVVQQQNTTLQVGLNTLAVEAPAATAGLYQLTLRTSDGHSQQQKVLIQP